MTLNDQSIDDYSQIASSTSQEALTLSLDTTLKLNCALTAPTPHHAVLLFSSDSESFAAPVRIRKSKDGHALRLEYDLAKAPLDLLALSLTSSHIQCSLHVSSFEVTTPGEQLVVPFGSFRFAESVKQTVREEQQTMWSRAPKEWEVDKFGAPKMQDWTFRPVEVGRGYVIGGVASVLVLLPPVGLLGYLVRLTHLAIRH